MAGTKCILDVEQSDQAMFGFVEKVLDTSNISSSNGMKTEVDGYKDFQPYGKASIQSQIINNGQLTGSTFRDKDDQQNNFGLPLLNSTFLPEKVMSYFILKPFCKFCEILVAEIVFPFIECSQN